AELRAELVRDLEALEGVDHPLRRTPPEAVRAPEDVVHAVVLDVLPDQVLGHDRVLNRKTAEGRADLALDVLHPRVALFELHERVVPGEVARRRVEEAFLLELR